MKNKLLVLTMVTAMAFTSITSMQSYAEDNVVWRYETAGEVSAGTEISVFADGLEDDCTMISAIYNNGSLAELSVKECAETDKTMSITVPEDFSNDSVWVLKAFAWDGISSMKPIGNNLEVTLADEDITDKFTDTNFLNAVREAINKNDGESIYISDVINIKELNVQGSKGKEIYSLAGIEYFTSIEMFSCTRNKIEECDFSKNTKLKELACLANRITSLDVSANKELEILACGYNMRMTSLNVSDNPKLKELYCNYAKLQSLKPLNSPELVSIICQENELEELDISNNLKLEELKCCNNNLTSLDVSNNKNLKYFDCSYNRMKSVNDVKGLMDNEQIMVEKFKFEPQRSE